VPIYSLWFHVIKCRSLRPYFLRGNGSCSDSIDPISGVCRIVTYQILKEKYQQAHKIILLLASSYALHHIWVCLKIGYPMVRTGLSSCSLWKWCFFRVSPWQTHFRPTSLGRPWAPRLPWPMIWTFGNWSCTAQRGRVGACGAMGNWIRLSGAMGNWIWFDADMLCLYNICIYIYTYYIYMIYMYIYPTPKKSLRNSGLQEHR